MPLRVLARVESEEVEDVHSDVMVSCSRTSKPRNMLGQKSSSNLNCRIQLAQPREAGVRHLRTKTGFLS